MGWNSGGGHLNKGDNLSVITVLGNLDNLDLRPFYGAKGRNRISYFRTQRTNSLRSKSGIAATLTTSARKQGCRSGPFVFVGAFCVQAATLDVLTADVPFFILNSLKFQSWSANPCFAYVERLQSFRIEAVKTTAAELP